MPTYVKTLLPATTISTAVNGLVTDRVFVGQVPDGCTYLAAQASFLYGSGGTTAKAWIQTSLDGGLTWCDIMNFAFTTAAAAKVSAVGLRVALAAGVTPTDATLADNTILNGLLGDRLRVKYTTTGTYAGATSLKVTAVLR